MKKELDELLCSRYPHIFCDRHADMRETAMCWGFACDDGWFDLIDVLCEEIQRQVDEGGCSQVKAVQVKEKFGSLHFYERGGDDFSSGLIWMADFLSMRICETCGAPGVRVTDGWHRTCCIQHSDGALTESDLVRRVVDPGQMFTLPPIRHPHWAHFAVALEDTIDNDMQRNHMPPIVIDEVIETETLNFRWHGGDDDGRARAFFRLFEAYVCRVALGRIRS